MPPLPEDFDWRQSRAHVKLLSHFVKPRDEAQVLGWQFVREGLKEKTKSALERFRREGCLVPATVEESLDCLFTAAELKAALKKVGAKQTGAKAELIERLVATSITDGPQKLRASRHISPPTRRCLPAMPAKHGGRSRHTSAHTASSTATTAAGR